jgi:uncharacterized protein (UPF0335 family)
MRILAWSLHEILEEVKRLEGEQKDLKTEITKLAWYMRGGITLDEAYTMSYEDRQIVSSIIKENLETTKKSGLPFF